MSNSRILIVEDDRKTAESLRLYLEHAGFEVTLLANGHDGLDAARSGQFDLLVLDLMLPRIDGLDLCKQVRRDSALPIIMVTARAAEDDRVRGLDLGADDYMTKPFSPRELVARVRAVLRRTGQPMAGPGSRLEHGDLVIDLERFEAFHRGEAAALTKTEFKLLETMARSPGRVFSRDELVERVFGQEFVGLDRTVDVHIMNLRKKIEPERSNPTFVQTVFGLGYRFADQAARDEQTPQAASRG